MNLSVISVARVYVRRVAPWLLAVGMLHGVVANADDLDAIRNLPDSAIVDGNIDTEVRLILQQSQLRRVLLPSQPNTFFATFDSVTQPFIGVAAISTDDVPSDLGVIGADGFRDSAVSAVAFAGASAELYCNLVTPLCPSPSGNESFCDSRAILSQFDPEPDHIFDVLRSPMNTGQIIVIYLPDSSGTLADGDDSLLYVALDIANGTPHTVVENGVPRAIDVQLFPRPDGGPATICNNGLRPVSGNPAAILVMPPFDTDGDGSTMALTRFPPVSTFGTNGDRSVQNESYQFRVDVCGIELGSVILRGRSLGSTTAFGLELAPSGIFKGAGAPAVLTFPAVPADPNQDVATFLEGRAAAGIGDDIEFLVRGIDTAIDNYFPTSYEVDRLRFVTSGAIVTTSDNTRDPSADDQVFATVGGPFPDLEVTKQVRCVGEPDTAWTSQRDVFPGSDVEFRIRITNLGTSNLSVVIEDLLAIEAGSGAIVTPIASPTSLSVERIRRENGVAEPIDFNNAVQRSCNRFFFGTNNNSFLLNNLNGTPICLGVLRGRADPCEPNGPGDIFEIRFQARISAAPDFCNRSRLQVDVRNSVTVTGDPDFPSVEQGGTGEFGGPCPFPPDAPGTPIDERRQIVGNEAVDRHTEIDTLREQNANPPADDNVVTLNVLCRSITFEKNVCYDDDDPDLDPDRCTDGNNRRLSLPAGPFPMNVVYRYTVTNNGDITESVSIRDCFLRADALAVGATILTCDLIPGALGSCPDRAGCVAGEGAGVSVELGPDAPNNTATVSCVIQFPDRTSLEAFLLRDDNDDVCGTNQPAPADPQCYRNCAEACAEAKSDACPGTPLDRVTSFVDLCYTPCEVEVRKEVRCLDNCIVPTDPNAGWVTSLPVLPGACLQYRLVITNTTPAESNIDLCAIDLADTLGNPAIFTGNPTDVVITGLQFATVTPDIRQPANAAALINGTTIRFRGGNPLQSGGLCAGQAGTPAAGSSFTITFRLQVKSLAELNGINNFNPSTNGVSVFGASTCQGNGDPVALDCEDLVNVVDTRCERGYTPPPGGRDDNTATVDPFRPSLTCEKSLVRYQWDCNTDCDPTNDPFTNFAAPVASPDGPVYVDLLDKVFPVIVEYRIRITNNGETCLRVTANDTDFAADVTAAPGVDFVAGQNQLGQQRDIQPAASSDWLFQVRFDTAEAARAFAARDDARVGCRNVLPGRFIYRNCADITATVCPGGNFCYPATPINLGAGDGCFAQLEFPPCPTITVVKEVKCDNAPDGAYAESATGLPGSRFRFRVRITNTSGTVKIPRLCVRDVFDECGNAAACAAWLANPPPYTAVLRRAGGASNSITACLPASIVNNPTELCFNLGSCGLPSPDCGANGRWLAPGDVIEITFDVRAPIDPATYTCSDPIDLRNTVRARAFADVCNNSNACDDESDFAFIDIRKPQVTCAKEICWDRDANGTCSGNESFTNALDLPCDAMRASQNCGQCGPRDLNLIYRFRVTNPCDVPLTNVRICDDQLVADVLAAGGTIVSCDLCNGPCNAGGNDNCSPTFTLAPGATVERFCRIRFTTVAQWLAFAGLDSDNDRFCYSNTARTEGQVDTAGLCISGAVTTVTPSECSASVCLAPSDIEVRKQVRCLPNCTTQGIGPEDGWVDDLQIVPGACLQWRIIVTNASPDVPICAVRLRDEFLAACGDIFTGLPFDVQVVGPVPPWGSIIPDIRQPANAGRLIDNTCIVFSSGTLDPGEAFTVLFRRDVKPLADFPAACYGQVIENNVSVEGAGDCPGGVPAYCSCDTADTPDTPRESGFPPGDDDNDTKVRPRRPSLTCQSKTWAFQQDTNADCEPDGPFSAQVRDLDLSNAMFPVILRLRITALNDGQVPLQVTPSDPELINCVNVTPGVAFLAGCELNPPVTRCVCPGQTAVWECLIRVETAEAGRQLALCDTAGAACADGGQLPDAPRRYRNRASMSGVMVNNCTPACAGNLPFICIPPPPNNSVPGRDACCATILFPPECAVEVSKSAVCIEPCPDGNPDGPVQDVELIVTPGACVRYIVTIRNSGSVAIKRLRLADVYRCGVITPGSLRAELLRAGGGPLLDVTACFDELFVSGAQFYTFDCLATDRFLAPNDVLRLTFDDRIETGDNACSNSVDASGYTEVCTAQGAPERPCPDNDSVNIVIRRPSVTCAKDVCWDQNGNGTCDVGEPRSSLLILDGASYPLQLVYVMTVTNGPQMAIANVQICDPNLVANANAAGAQVVSCDLVDNAGQCLLIPGPPGQCVTIPGPIAPNGTATATCVIRFPDAESFERFARTDGEADDCYLNTVTVCAAGQPGPDECGPAVPVSTTCTARVCVPPPAPCPPIVKIKFDVWNQNEVRFSGAERCIQSWLCLPLSQWIEPPTPNFFQRSLLGTNAGKARMEGMASARCNQPGLPDSVDAPLLGVAVNVLEFQNFPGGSRIEKAGSPLVGTLPTNRRLAGYVGEFDGPASPPGVPSSFYPAQVSRRGSALAFVKVEIKWDWTGRLIQDTFIELTNDNNIAVNAHLWFINGSNRDCNWANNTITLTANEPSYWAASTGLPKGVSPFTVLGNGEVDDDPRNQNPNNPLERGRVLRGYIIAHAVNDSNVEINWPYLMGRATIVNYREALAWEYEPWAFAAVAGQNTGTRNDPARVLLQPYLKLDFDGAEYEFAPSQLVLPFYASGSHPFDKPNQPVNTETELTIWAALKQLGQP